MVIGPQFVWGEYTPDFGYAFQIACIYFGVCGRFWLSFIQRAWRLGGEKRKKEDRIAVKPKSADKYAK